MLIISNFLKIRLASNEKIVYAKVRLMPKRQSLIER